MAHNDDDDDETSYNTFQYDEDVTNSIKNEYTELLTINKTISLRLMMAVKTLSKGEHLCVPSCYCIMRYALMQKKLNRTISCCDNIEAKLGGGEQRDQNITCRMWSMKVVNLD